MYLKRLDIQGFKSFAQKTFMEFEPGITAVVGPNGSGKSNVADSVRWVLGEQSTKLLRGKKSDDVVFAGSDKRPRSGFAEVVATFDNSDRIIPVDTGEVSIGRRIDRSGESEYLINGQKVRLMDIVDLVLKSNIGTSRYTVIGQGTIDMLIMSGPGEIKSLLDEASGVKVYQIRREKTLKRLEHTAQNLIRVEDVVAELEPRLKSLRRQAKRMEAREEQEVELRILLREYWGGMYHGFAQKLAKLGVEKDSFLERQSTLNEQQSVLGRRRDSLLDKETGIGGKFAEIRNRITQLSNEKAALLEKKSILRGKLSGLKDTHGSSPELVSSELASSQAKFDRLTEQFKAESEELQTILENEKETETKLKEIGEQLDLMYSQLAEEKPVDQDALFETVASLERHTEDFLSKLDTGFSQDGLKELVSGFLSGVRTLRERISGLLGFKSVTSKFSGTKDLRQLSDLRKELEAKLKNEFRQRSGLEVSLQVNRGQARDLEQQILELRLELNRMGSKNLETFAGELAREQSDIDVKLEDISKEVNRQESLLLSFDEEAKVRRTGLSSVEQELRSLQEDYRVTQEQLSSVNVEIAKVETERELLEKEIVAFFGQNELEVITKDSKPASTPELEAKIARVRHSLEQIGSVDEMTMQEYRETEERFTRLSDQVQDLKKGMDDLKQVMDELDEHIRTKFNTAFHRVNEHFEKYFRILFSGGKANLSLVREQSKSGEEDLQEDVGEELRPEEAVVSKYESGREHVAGVEIKATPPGKKLASVQALSGGERALTAIALLCALLTCFPSPFVVLDEVDAALDEANTIRFGQILGSLAHQTQFVTITHNRETMAQSKTLYGVTMGDDGVSKILSIKFSQATEYAK